MLCFVDLKGRTKKSLKALTYGKLSIIDVDEASVEKGTILKSPKRQKPDAQYHVCSLPPSNLAKNLLYLGLFVLLVILFDLFVNKRSSFNIFFESTSRSIVLICAAGIFVHVTGLVSVYYPYRYYHMILAPALGHLSVFLATSILFFKNFVSRKEPIEEMADLFKKLVPREQSITYRTLDLVDEYVALQVAFVVYVGIVGLIYYRTYFYNLQKCILKFNFQHDLACYQMQRQLIDWRAAREGLQHQQSEVSSATQVYTL